MRRIRRIPFFERVCEYLLFVGAGGAPEAAGVLFGFLESAFPIGNDGTMVSPGAIGLANGVSQSVPIGSEGVPVVTSGVVDSEPVGNSRGFRMLGKKYLFLSRMGVIGGGWISKVTAFCVIEGNLSYGTKVKGLRRPFPKHYCFFRFFEGLSFAWFSWFSVGAEV